MAPKSLPSITVFNSSAETIEILRLLQSSEALKDVEWVITTTHRKRLEELVGECGEIYEVVGKPYDLIQITNAVKTALAAA